MRNKIKEAAAAQAATPDVSQQAKDSVTQATADSDAAQCATRVAQPKQEIMPPTSNAINPKDITSEEAGGLDDDQLIEECRQRAELVFTSQRRLPVHPKAVRFLSCEPLLEDISKKLDLTGIGWLIAGGESGSNPEYLCDAKADWKKELGSLCTGS